MNNGILVICPTENNLLNAIKSYFEIEKINYTIKNKIENTKFTQTIIYIGDITEDFKKIAYHHHLSFIWINNIKKIIDLPFETNYIITDLIDDQKEYTEVQKEYLFRKGIYHQFLNVLKELIENPNHYNGIIYDLTNLLPYPNNWIFHFDSINETYDWLLKKNRLLPNSYERKIINFYSEKVYDDSLREINYLTDKLKEIKEKRSMIDIFICTKEELKLFRRNYFFKLLLKNICPTYQFYIVDKDKLVKTKPNLVTKLMDGIAIYNDCVYRDTYEDEYSLGYVDCNENTIQEYNQYFEEIKNKYGIEIHKESDLDEF